MSMNLPVFIGMTSGVKSRLRDILIDRLQANTMDEIIENDLEQITDWQSMPPSLDRRILRLINTVHSKDELKAMIARAYRNIGTGLNSNSPLSNLIGGGIETVTCGFVIGVAASLAAAAIYDYFNDETYTTTITDDNGTDWEVVTDNDGRVISIKRKGDEVSSQ